MIKTQSTKNTGSTIPVKRGIVDSLTVYEVTDYELDQLEEGGPSSLYLNFSLTLLSIGLSFLVSLLETTIESERVYISFVVVTAISLILGTLLFILWIRSRKSISSLTNKIKQRCL